MTNGDVNLKMEVKAFFENAWSCLKIERIKDEKFDGVLKLSEISPDLQGGSDNKILNYLADARCIERHREITYDSFVFTECGERYAKCRYRYG